MSVIAGATVKIDGDGSDAERALRGVRDEAQKTEKSLGSISEIGGKIGAGMAAAAAGAAVLAAGLMAAHAAASTYMETTTSGRTRLAEYNAALDESYLSIGRVIAESDAYQDALDGVQAATEEVSETTVTFIAAIDDLYQVYQSARFLTVQLDEATGGWMSTISEGVASLNPFVAALDGAYWAAGKIGDAIELASDTVDALTGTVAVARPMVNSFADAFDRVSLAAAPARRAIAEFNAEQMRGRAAAAVSEFAGPLVGWYDSIGEAAPVAAAGVSQLNTALADEALLLQDLSAKLKELSELEAARAMAPKPEGGVIDSESNKRSTAAKEEANEAAELAAAQVERAREMAAELNRIDAERRAQRVASAQAVAAAATAEFSATLSGSKKAGEAVRDFVADMLTAKASAYAAEAAALAFVPGLQGNAAGLAGAAAAMVIAAAAIGGAGGGGGGSSAPAPTSATAQGLASPGPSMSPSTSTTVNVSANYGIVGDPAASSRMVTDMVRSAIAEGY